MEFLTQDILTEPVWMWASFLTLVADLMGWEKFPAAVSLGVTFTILAGGIVWSLWRPRPGQADGAGS